MEAPPQVFCHLDMHPVNLFDVDGDTVLIDWAFCGVGGLGEDLGTLVVDAITDFHREPDQVRAWSSACRFLLDLAGRLEATPGRRRCRRADSMIAL